jgi:suppressor for copper-sensitivity B
MRSTLRQVMPVSLCGRALFMLIFYALAFVQMPLRADLASGDAAGPWVGDPAIGEARLVSAVTGTGDLRELPLGLEFRLAPGWKIYWRTPGEAGLPPKLELQLASGHAVTNDIHWPVPKRFDAFGFDNFGYDNKVILPITLKGHPKGAAVQIIGQMEALACADICVPFTGEIGLSIVDGPATASPHAMEIARYRAKIPRNSGTSPIQVEAIWQDGNKLQVKFDANSPVIDDIFVEGAPSIAFKKPFYANGLASIDLAGKLDAPLSGQVLDLTIVADQFFVTSRHIVAQAEPVPDTLSDIAPSLAFKNSGMWAIAAFAFLGGLILNLMPCVLPVLAIKLAAIIDSSGQSRGLVRMRFAAGAVGILASFGVIALGLAVLRFGGGQIGWGIQYQSPIFLTMMMFVLGLFTLNMLDRFFLPVPSFLAVPSSLQALDRSGPNGTANHASWKLLAGDFIAGMLATLLATPCSAPFVGSAVTVALSGDTLQLFGILMVMGTGLAAPWMMVALFPDFVRFLPKPGPWMGWLKRGLAGLLMATMVWIGWLLAAVQGGIAATLTICIIGLGLLTVLWRPRFVTLLAVAGLFACMWALPPPAVIDPPQATGLVWQPWSEDARRAAQDDGKLVLLDITADWCITCKANKRFVLEKEPVAGMLAKLSDDRRLVMLQADWTRSDPRILAFLASHQRFGIPFNIIYGPAAPNGIVLGELLGARMIEKALIDAGMTR